MKDIAKQKKVNFNKYCPSCKHFYKYGSSNYCGDCLLEHSNIDDKPNRYVKKEIKK